MHTVRNRIASRPPVSISFGADSKPPIQRASHQDLSRLARSAASPDGASMPCGLAAERAEDRRPAKRRNPKGKKARKAAARKAAVAAAVAANPALAARAPAGKGRKDKRRNGGLMMPPAPPPLTASGCPVAELELGAMRDLCLQAEPALALLLPSQCEPLVEAPAPFAQPETAAEPAEVRLQTLASMPELLVETSGTDLAAEARLALTLPDLPEPLVENPASRIAPLPLPSVEATPVPRAAALAALADAQIAPLPRSRALVPARRQGLVDVIAFLLRDSGRRLARWSARRHKTRAEQAALRQAEARQLNLRRELEALDALRRNGG